MAKVGELVASLELNTKNFDRGVRNAEGKLSGISSKIKNVGGQLQAMGGQLTAAVTAPILGIGGAALKAASDAEETQNRFDAIFRNLKSEADSFAEGLGDSVGRTTTEIQNGMAAFGGMAQGFGMADDKALDFAKDLQRLSIDFASFNNISDAEAQQRFIAAMSGSSEVMDQFGVNIKAAALDAKLLENGFPTIAEGASEAQKAVSRLGIIEDTMGRQGAVGDAIKTSGSFANQMKATRAELMDVAETIGKELIPVVQPFLEGIKDLLKEFSDLSPETRKIIVTVALLAAAIGPLLVVLGMVISAAGTLGGAIAAIGLAPFIGIVAALAGTFAILFDYFQKNGVTMEAVFNKFKPVLESVRGVADNFLSLLATLGETVLPLVQSFLEPIFKKALPFIESVAGLAGDILWVFGELAQAVLPELERVLGPVLEVFGGLVAGVLEGVIKVIDKIREAIDLFKQMQSAEQKAQEAKERAQGVAAERQERMSRGELLSTNLRQRLFRAGVLTGDANQDRKKIQKALELQSMGQTGSGFVAKVRQVRKVGTPYVPTDRIVKVHEGEAIIPKKDNPFRGKNRSMGGGTGMNVTQNFYDMSDAQAGIYLLNNLLNRT